MEVRDHPVGRAIARPSQGRTVRGTRTYACRARLRMPVEMFQRPRACDQLTLRCLGAPGARDGRAGGQASWPTKELEAGRPPRDDPGLDRREGRPHHRRDQGAAGGRAPGERWRGHGVELPRSLRPDVQKKTAHAAEQDRPDVKQEREAWFDGQLDLDPARLIFIDETWASTNMARRCGRAMKGERLRLASAAGSCSPCRVTHANLG